MRMLNLQTAVRFSALAAALALASTAQAQSLEKKDITIGVAGSSSQIALLAFNVARTKGFIKAEGIELEVVDFGSGSKGVQAFVSKNVDMVAATFEHVIAMRSRNVAAKSVVSMSRAPGIVLAVTKNFESQFKTVADLKGKAIGVSAPGSASHTFLNLFLARHGLKPDDVSVVGVGNAAGAVAAVRTGNELQAIVNYDPVITQLERTGHAKAIIDLRTASQTKEFLRSEFTFLSLIAHDDLIKRHPRSVQAVVTGVVKALKWIASAKPEEVLLAVPEEFWKQDRELYLETIRRNLDGLSLDGRVTPAGAEGVYSSLLAHDERMRAGKPDLSTTFDNQFVDKALQLTN